MLETGTTAVAHRHLTRSEKEILEELAAGRTKTEVADRIGISVRTVSFHLNSMFKKFAVTRIHSLLVASGYLVRPTAVGEEGRHG